VFIEPYIARARHVEVQVIGDTHGTIVHLGERECSIQRRNQKIIEEAPSAGITPETRKALWDGALALAHRVGYVNAGTVEFLVGDSGAVNFLEVNTRLQVEHPVTELVTGLDLVELQLRVAAGEALPISQADVEITGHAIEARLVAEDPAAGWVPATGEVTAYAFGDGVRVDSGVRAGSIVSADYDSLLAKVIAHSPTREQAARALAKALRSAHIAGPATNRDALVVMLGESDFLAGVTPTTYLDEHPDVLTAAGPVGDDRLALLLAAAVHRALANKAADERWGFVRPGWRNVATMGQRSTWRDGTGATHHLEEMWANDREVTVLVGLWPEPGDDGALGPDERRRVAVRVLSTEKGRIGLEIDGVRRVIRLTGSTDTRVTTTSAAGGVTWRLEPRFVDHDAAEAGSGSVSPLPGTVIAVTVAPGDVVGDGDVLLVIEAMKMEHKIRASGPATVAEVRFAVGDRVDTGDLLVRLDAVR
jgi:propionyl-CoA carboxylase alpha chain